MIYLKFEYKEELNELYKKGDNPFEEIKGTVVITYNIREKAGYKVSECQFLSLDSLALQCINVDECISLFLEKNEIKEHVDREEVQEIVIQLVHRGGSVEMTIPEE